MDARDFWLNEIAGTLGVATLVEWTETDWADYRGRLVAQAPGLAEVLATISLADLWQAELARQRTVLRRRRAQVPGPWDGHEAVRARYVREGLAAKENADTLAEVVDYETERQVRSVLETPPGGWDLWPHLNRGRRSA